MIDHKRKHPSHIKGRPACAREKAAPRKTYGAERQLDTIVLDLALDRERLSMRTLRELHGLCHDEFDRERVDQRIASAAYTAEIEALRDLRTAAREPVCHGRKRARHLMLDEGHDEWEAA